MKILNFDKLLKKKVDRLFDTYFEISVFTARPGNIDYEEVGSIQNGFEFKVKHLAAFIALEAIETGQSIDYYDKYSLLNKIVKQLRDDSANTVCRLNKAFNYLMEYVIRLN